MVLSYCTDSMGHLTLKQMLDEVGHLGIGYVEMTTGGWSPAPHIRIDELLPLFEKEGIRVEIQSHPYDFCELNNETVDMVKSYPPITLSTSTLPLTAFSMIKAEEMYEACSSMPETIFRMCCLQIQ
jgi:histidinol phosphatase-like PHP family hydrolase